MALLVLSRLVIPVSAPGRLAAVSRCVIRSSERKEFGATYQRTQACAIKWNRRMTAGIRHVVDSYFWQFTNDGFVESWNRTLTASKHLD